MTNLRSPSVAGDAAAGPRMAVVAAVAFLTAVNVVKYVHRQAPYALLPLIQADLGLADYQLGALASAFMAAYVVAALPLGWLASRGSRWRWIAGSAAAWSLATLGSGWCGGLWSLVAARCATGGAQAGYGAVAPAAVADGFPGRGRGTALALYSTAIPLGSALGYVAAGRLGLAVGWRACLMLLALPGLALACAALVLSRSRRENRSPDGGAGPAPAAANAFPDGAADARPPASTAPAACRDYRALFGIPSFAAGTFAMALMTFALGGMAVWMPMFFVRVRGLDVSRAGDLFGAVTAGAGLLGIALGGWLAERRSRDFGKAYFLVAGWGMLAGLPLAVAAVLVRDLRLSLALLFAAEFLVFLYMGPLNAVVASVTSPDKRTLAFAANIFVVHAVGDTLSPAAIGAASDALGLRTALVLALSCLAPAAGLCLWGAGHYDQDSQQACAVG
ncbi:MAG: MFS transporter [Elusimicrobia bacterium]|nr:MFS transporter [Elusimicrobiota bacterium]